MLKHKAAILSISIAFFAFLNIACSNEEVSSDIVSEGTPLTKEQEKLINSQDKQSYKGLEDVFSDTSDIKTDGKQLLLVFGQRGCVYCEILKDQIKEDKKLKAFIQDKFKSYYISLDYAKNHNIEFLNKSFITNDLSKYYNLAGTPLIVLADSKGNDIIKLSGYPGKDMFAKMVYFSGNKGYGDAKDANERMKVFMNTK